MGGSRHDFAQIRCHEARPRSDPDSPICWSMLRYGVGTVEWQRKHGKLGEARRSADRLLTLAKRLARSYPGQAPAYALLSEGYLQRAKIAYRVDNEPVIGWERKSLDAALRAVTLDPENDKAQRLVNNRLTDWPSWHRNRSVRTSRSAYPGCSSAVALLERTVTVAHPLVVDFGCPAGLDQARLRGDEDGTAGSACGFSDRGNKYLST